MATNLDPLSPQNVSKATDFTMVFPNFESVTNASLGQTFTNRVSKVSPNLKGLVA